MRAGASRLQMVLWASASAVIVAAVAVIGMSVSRGAPRGAGEGALTIRIVEREGEPALSFGSDPRLFPLDRLPAGRIASLAKRDPHGTIRLQVGPWLKVGELARVQAALRPLLPSSVRWSLAVKADAAGDSAQPSTSRRSRR